MSKKYILISNFAKYFLLLIIALLFLVLPNINNQEYINPTIISKFIYFIYGCLGLLTVLVLFLITEPRLEFSISKVDIALLALLIYITVNRYFIQSDNGFSIRYLELLGLSFLYFVLRLVPFKDYILLLLIILISGICQAVYGSMQLLEVYASNHSGFKLTGSFFNPGPYAGFLTMIWIIAFGMYLFNEEIVSQLEYKKKSKYLLIKKLIEYCPLLGMVSIVLVLPASKSRAAWIALVIGSLVLIEMKFGVVKRLQIMSGRYKKSILILLTVCIFSVGLLLYYFKKESSDGRLFIWKVTTEMIVDAPLFGAGIDGFKTHYMNYQAGYFHKNESTTEASYADDTSYAFNDWLQFLAENGFVGVLFLIIATFIIYKTKWKAQNKVEALIAKSGLTSVCVFACFSYPMEILPIKLILIFLLAVLSNSSLILLNFTTSNGQKTQWITRIIVIIISIVSIYEGALYSKRLNVGFTRWANAEKSYHDGDYSSAVKKYDAIYSIFKKDGNFLMNYGKTLTMAKKYDKAISVLENAKPYLSNTVIEIALGDSRKACGQYIKAETAYQQAINMAPSKFYGNYLLAKLYDDSGQRDKASALAKKILSKEIKIPSTAIKEMQMEMKQLIIKNKNPLGLQK